MTTLSSLGPAGVIRFPGGLVQLWVGDATTSGGVATFYPTVDGTSSGAALFRDIAGAFPAAESNTATLTAAPMAAIKFISADRTAVTVNCFTGTVLGIVGATLLAAPDGTVVHLLLLGT